MALLEATADMVAFGGELRDGESRYVLEEALDWLRASRSVTLTVDLARVEAMSFEMGAVLRVFAEELRAEGRTLRILASEAARTVMARRRP